MAVHIVTWMWSHDSGYSGYYPQGGDVTRLETQLAYWRCCYTLFHSSKVLHRPGDVHHHFYCNRPGPKFIDGIDTWKLESFLEMHVHELKPRQTIPDDYFSHVTTQFYIIDILEHLTVLKASGAIRSGDVIMILDSDVIFNRAISQELIEDVSKYGCIPYHTNRTGIGGDDYVVYGLSPSQCRSLAEEYSGRQFEDFYWAGGEFLCFSERELEKITTESRIALDISLKRHSQGEMKYNTEEQLFGYVFGKLGYPGHLGEKYIRRIYTNPGNFCFSQEEHGNLVLWHLLTEKRRALALYFRTLTSDLNLTRDLDLETFRDYPIPDVLEVDISEPVAPG